MRTLLHPFYHLATHRVSSAPDYRAHCQGLLRVETKQDFALTGPLEATLGLNSDILDLQFLLKIFGTT